MLVKDGHFKKQVTFSKRLFWISMFLFSGLSWIHHVGRQKEVPTPKKIKKVQITTNNDHFGPQPTLLKTARFLVCCDWDFFGFFSVEANLRVAELLLEQNKETEVEGAEREERETKIDGGFNVLIFFLFIPRGKQSNLTNIFIQLGWLNHQLTRPTKAFFYQLKKDLIWL